VEQSVAAGEKGENASALSFAYSPVLDVTDSGLRAGVDLCLQRVRLSMFCGMVRAKRYAATQKSLCITSSAAHPLFMASAAPSA